MGEAPGGSGECRVVVGVAYGLDASDITVCRERFKRACDDGSAGNHSILLRTAWTSAKPASAGDNDGSNFQGHKVPTRRGSPSSSEAGKAPLLVLESVHCKCGKL